MKYLPKLHHSGLLLGAAAFLGAAAPKASAQLTDGLIAHWPLDEVNGSVTPDLVNGYNMSLVNLSGDDLTEGKFGQAMSFSQARKTMLQYVSQPGEKLPANDNNESFTISLWVKGKGTGQNDLRAFSEGSTDNSNPLFNIGTHSGGADDTLDIYVRGNNGTINHVRSTGTPFDDSWRMITWAQAGEVVSVYIDGVKDDIAIEAGVSPIANPEQNYQVNTTTIGGILRSNESHWWTGLVDDVGIWDRALTEAEVQQVFADGVPLLEGNVVPLTLRSFKPERPIVAKNDLAILRWVVGGGDETTTYTINPGSIDVTANTNAGKGSIELPFAAETTYTLTATRGDETVSDSTTVGVIDGIGPGWSLLDSFESWDEGSVREVSGGTWTEGNSDLMRVVTVEGNKVLTSNAGGALSASALETFETSDAENRSFFMQFYMEDDESGISVNVGVTNKAMPFVGDANGGVGAYVNIRRADGESNGEIAIGPAANDALDFSVEPGVWYKLWLDVTNAPGDSQDTTSVHIQAEGEAGRTTLIEDAAGDAGNLANLSLFLIAPRAETTGEQALLIDNIFASRDGLLDTDPLDTDDPNLAIRTRGLFDDLVPGGGAVTKQVPIFNIGGTKALNITGATISGADGSLFTLGDFPATLEPGAQGVVNITFDPAGKTGGVLATLELTSNDQTSPSIIVDLSTIVPSTNQLVGHYRMDETAGDELLDAALLKHGNYIKVGSGDFQLGQDALADGTAVKFVRGGDTDGGYAQVRPGGGTLSSFSVSMWVNKTDANNSSLFAKGEQGSSPAFSALYDGTNLYWFIEDQGDPIPVGTMDSNETHHVVVSYQDDNGSAEGADRLAVYINGEEAYTEDNPAELPDSGTLPFLLGSYYGTLSLSGTMDDVQIYAKPLTLDDAKSLFDTPGSVLGENLTLDTDGDGVPDVIETADGTDPEDPDSDNDGLNDGAEKTAGTMPNNPDTDSDGYLDGREVALGYDPLSAASPGADAPDPALVAYWPLDEITDGMSPDAGGLFHLTAVNLTSDNVVAGKAGSAISLSNADETMLEYLAEPGEELPISIHPAQTVSFWVKGKGTGQTDFRIFSEGSTTDNNPLFNIGTQNTGETDAVDMYIRPPNAHQYSEGLALDDTWRHLAWTEEGETGTLYIDGVADTFAGWNTGSFAEGDLDTTSIGGIRRADPSHWFTGLVDDVSLWSRALSASEVASLAGGTSPLDLRAGNGGGGGGEGDSDGDGVSDASEAIAGTNPNDATDYFRISELVSSENGIELSWPAVAEKTYEVQFSTDLENWETIGTAIMAVDGATMSATYTDADAGRTSQVGAYYRAVTQ